MSRYSTALPFRYTKSTSKVRSEPNGSRAKDLQSTQEASTSLNVQSYNHYNGPAALSKDDVRGSCIAAKGDGSKQKIYSPGSSADGSSWSNGSYDSQTSSAIPLPTSDGSHPPGSFPMPQARLCQDVLLVEPCRNQTQLAEASRKPSSTSISKVGLRGDSLPTQRYSPIYLQGNHLYQTPSDHEISRGDMHMSQINFPEILSPYSATVLPPAVPQRSSKRLTPRSRPAEAHTVIRDGVRHKMKQEGDAQYEYVEGVIMNTQPKGNARADGLGETIPEIEARDIKTIPKRRVENILDDNVDSLRSDSSSIFGSTGSVETDRDSTETGSSSDGTFRTSSGPSNSTNSVRSRGFKHDPGLTESGQNEHDTQQWKFGQENKWSVVPKISESGLNVGGLVMRKRPLGAINEEESHEPSNFTGADSAPVPTIGGSHDHSSTRDVQIQNDASPTERVVQSANHVANRFSTRKRDMAKEDELRVLATSGIGSDPHIYEGAITQEESESNETNSASHISTRDSDETASQSSVSSSVFHSVGNSIGKVAQVVHDSVKKRVTFNPVDDVHTITPSSNRSLEDIRMRSN